ncbi:MAG: uracil-DNA glycosylase [Burkholderiaceae bacterium]|nr:uracil-DNA glycosylase [Burkholderiaceae bacterium]
MNAAHARLWNLLGLGPLWTERAAATAGRFDAQATPEAAGAPVGRMNWDELERNVTGCTACGLCKGRTRTVFGVGSRDSEWMVIGEGPGAEEDLRGEPFVGQAGRLLDSILAAAGLGRSASGHAGVYIANVVKCRPPGNRNPEPDEVAHCEPYLRRQIELLRPRIILLLGRVAAQAMIGTDASIASLRGRVHRLEIGGSSVPTIVTYHPAYLLRNLADKAKVWADLCLAHEVFKRSERSPTR